jgi:SAM-dependent methyltransferase
MASPTSYDHVADFGALYDAVPAYAARRDVPFYLAEAARAGGSGAAVVELGCGTGRVLLPLARAGYAVTGVDASAAMLARCQAKLAAEPPAVRARTTLYEADVRHFEVPKPAGARDAAAGFHLALAPFRVFQHLRTIADQLRCLESVRAHLAPRGRLAFDVFNPHFAAMTRDRSAEEEDTPELPLADGRYLRRTARVPRIHWVEQLSDVELIYYVRTGTAVERFVHSFQMRWYGAAELEHLLARSGYRVEGMYGDFDRSPLRDDSPEIVVVAVRED